MNARRNTDPTTRRSRRAANAATLGAWVVLAGSAVLAPVLPWLDGVLFGVLLGALVLALAWWVAAALWAWFADEVEAGRPRAGRRAAWRAIERGRGDR